MAPLAKKYNKVFTYKDYCNWPDDEQWEIIEGVPFDMSPSPGPYHQEILLELSVQFSKFFKERSCKVYFAPFDVRFSEHKNPADHEIINVVQPDLVVICDKEKIDEHGCLGAPDLIVEILSPSTIKKDMSEKYSLYEKFGVKEYWIVDPGSKVLHLYKLDNNGKYIRDKIYVEKDIVSSQLFADLVIKLEDVFNE